MSSAAHPDPVTASAPGNEGEQSFLKRYGALLPYAIALGAQIPLLIYYFATLWGKPHYQSAPFAIIMVAVFAYSRWPRHAREPFFKRKTSVILFWAGVIFGIAAALFSEAWFSATSMVLLMASLFAMTKDGEIPGKSLFSLALPLLVILTPPNNLDRTIITTLQRVSATISSWYLDILNFKHFSPGTTLNFPDQQYEVEQACSGVQSFFTLLICTSILIVAFRRPWFRAIPLLISAAFWAVFMNSIRILTIPIAEIAFGLDLKSGLPHDLLGYSAMIIAILLILSTDQLLEFMFGSSSSSTEDEKRPSMFRKAVPRSKTDSVDQQIREYFPVSKAFVRTGVVGALVVLALGSMQFIDFARSLSQPAKAIRAFTTDVIIDLDKQAIPETVESVMEFEEGETTSKRKFVWSQTDYDRADRTRGSDFGQRSDSWTYKSRSGLMARVSFDQTFPGWHELTTCYRNIGWQINAGARVKKTASIDIDGEEVEWSYIECDLLEPTTGRRGYLLFCFSDAEGLPISAPIEWGSLRSFVERAKNRLFHSLRASLFRGEAYQMQVFVLNSIDLHQRQKEEIRSQFMALRKEMRFALLEYGGEEKVDGSATFGEQENSEDASNAADSADN